MTRIKALYKWVRHFQEFVVVRELECLCEPQSYASRREFLAGFTKLDRSWLRGQTKNSPCERYGAASGDHNGVSPVSILNLA